MKSALALVCALIFPGCAIVSYSVKPDTAWNAAPPTKQNSDTLFYSISEFHGLTMGGHDRLKERMAHNPPFLKSEQVVTPPAKGLYLKIDTKQRDSSMGSLVWGYVALSTFFILPAYSGSSGFHVRYILHRDGKELKIYEYEIRRKGLAWFPLIVVGWVNFLTDYESDAFDATLNQFFTDAIRDGFMRASAS